MRKSRPILNNIIMRHLELLCVFQSHYQKEIRPFNVYKLSEFLMFVILLIQCVSTTSNEGAFLVDESYLQIYKELRHDDRPPESKRKYSDHFRYRSTPPDFTKQLTLKQQRQTRRQKSEIGISPLSSN